jgi:hypothetical protein
VVAVIRPSTVETKKKTAQKKSYSSHHCKCARQDQPFHSTMAAAESHGFFPLLTFLFSLTETRVAGMKSRKREKERRKRCFFVSLARTRPPPHTQLTFPPHLFSFTHASVACSTPTSNADTCVSSMQFYPRLSTHHHPPISFSCFLCVLLSTCFTSNGSLGQPTRLSLPFSFFPFFYYCPLRCLCRPTLRSEYKKNSSLRRALSWVVAVLISFFFSRPSLSLPKWAREKGAFVLVCARLRVCVCVCVFVPFMFR